MPADELMPFPELPDNDEIYSLDAFGGMRQNLNEEDNPLVQCYFSLTGTQKTADGQEKRYSLRNQQVCVELAIGYLPALTLGKTFRRQSSLPSNEWMPLEKIIVEIDAALAESKTIADLRLEKPLTADKNSRAVDRSGISKVRGKVLATNEKRYKWSEGKLHDLAFIDIELIRYYLTNSSFSCRKLFSGAFSEHRVGSDVINEKYETFHFENGKGRFVYRFRYRESDAPALGRILFDTSGHALRAAQRVHKSMQTDWINLSDGGIAFPRTYFPFLAKTTMTVRGRRLALKDGGYVFLVYQILGCSAPFPFDSLSYCNEVSQGGAPAPEGAPEAFSGMTRDKGPAHESDTVGRSKSNERPMATSVIIDIEEGERQFNDLEGKVLTYEKLRDSTHRASPQRWRYLENLCNASTGPGTTGQSSAARQSVNAAISPSEPLSEPLSVDLKTFLEILACIRRKEQSWSLKTIPAGESKNVRHDYESNEWRCWFPLVSCPTRTELDRQFSFMNIERTVRKRLVCAEIEVGGLYVYLFEAERRPDTTNHRLSILLVHRHGYEKVNGQDFSNLLKATVSNGGWPAQKDLPDFRRHDVSHGKNAKAVEDIADRIVQNIKLKLPEV